MANLRARLSLSAGHGPKTARDPLDQSRQQRIDRGRGVPPGFFLEARIVAAGNPRGPLAVVMLFRERRIRSVSPGPLAGARQALHLAEADLEGGGPEARQ